MNSYLAEWFELECVLSPSVKREKTIDIRKEVDWKAIEQSLFGAAICAGCAIIEKAKRKGQDIHTKNIFELRNAFVHNNCDLSGNQNKNSLVQAKDYLSNKVYKTEPLGLPKPFYTLNDSLVLFNDGIYLAVRGCLQNA